jgi:predicted DNA-binding ribbon-helix-helix protein
MGLSMKKEVGVLNARDVRRLITGLDSESARSKEMSVAVRVFCGWVG